MTPVCCLPVRVLLLCLLSSCLSYAGVHPTRIDESTNCLECHSDKTTGKHVHPAVNRGCTSCHSIENRVDQTEVGLRQENASLCFQCHEQETFRSVHFPYKSGNCTRCHEPHASSNARLLRAKVNDLCLKCHLRTGESIASRYLPTIELTSGNVGHPFAGHPVSGKPDPLTGEEMSCISCHLAHGGNKPHLLRMGSQVPEDALNQNVETKDMCSKCHEVMWGIDGGAGKRNKRKGK